MTDPCPECQGKTIETRGSGMDLQYRVCSRWKEPGHLSAAEITNALRVAIETFGPRDRQGKPKERFA